MSYVWFMVDLKKNHIQCGTKVLSCGYTHGMAETDADWLQLLKKYAFLPCTARDSDYEKMIYGS